MHMHCIAILGNLYILRLNKGANYSLQALNTPRSLPSPDIAKNFLSLYVGFI